MRADALDNQVIEYNLALNGMLTGRVQFEAADNDRLDLPQALTPQSSSKTLQKEARRLLKRSRRR